MTLENETFSQVFPDIVAMCGRCNDFEAFVREYAIYVSDMTSHLVDDSGNIIVDFIGRFEQLHESVASLCGRTGLSLSLPHINRSEHEHYCEYYTAQTANR